MNFACVRLETASKELAEVLELCYVVDVDLFEIAAKHPRVEVEARLATPGGQLDRVDLAPGARHRTKREFFVESDLETNKQKLKLKIIF